MGKSVYHVVKMESEAKIQAHIKQAVEMEPERLSVKLFLSKSDKKVLYGEVGEEFVDRLFSLLVLPLGFIMKCLSGNSNLGSIDNLYKSVEDLKVNECMISEHRKVMLLSPVLAPYSGCDNQLIQTTEMLPTDLTVTRCTNCSLLSKACRCCASKKLEVAVLSPTNPKNRDLAKESGGRYVMGPVKYMVTDGMVIKPLSFISIMDTVHHFKKPMFDIEEKTICIGEAEVMALLRGALITKTALSSAFSPKEKEGSQHL